MATGTLWVAFGVATPSQGPFRGRNPRGIVPAFALAVVALAVTVSGAPAQVPTPPPTPVPTPVPAPAVQACAPARTALVLGGGGSKGFAHIGVLQIMDSLGIRPDLIVGTSIGAIVGGLYASGYSGNDIEKIAQRMTLGDVIRGYEPQLPSGLRQLTPLAVWERDAHAGYRLQAGTVREGEINALMSSVMLRGNLLARGNFDSLRIPFRAIATDLASRKRVVLASGDLARAVRASFAIPLIFTPVSVNGRPLTDGGLSENVPLLTARGLGAERAIISTLPSKDMEIGAYRDPFTVAGALTDFLFTRDSLALKPDDVLLTQLTEHVDQLSFARDVTDSLIASGRAVARAAFAAARCVRPIAAPLTRELPKRVGQVTVSEERAVDRLGLRRALGLNPGATLAVDSLELRLQRLGKSENYTGVWLTPTGRDSVVRFDVAVERTATRLAAFGVAYDNDMVGRMWVGMSQRGLLGSDLMGSVIAKFGKYNQEVTATLHRESLAEVKLLPITVNLTLGRTDVRTLTVANGDPVETAPLQTNELVLYTGLSDTPSEGFSWDIGTIGHSWDEPGRGRTAAGGIRAGVDWRLNDEHSRLRLEGSVTNEYWKAWVQAATVFQIEDIEVRPHIYAGYGYRLPRQQWYFLGGWNGFPGFRVTENQGEQAIYGGVLFRRHLTSVVRVRADLMGGAISYGDGILKRRTGPTDAYTGVWYYGARIGIEAGTPIGTILLQEGLNNDNRTALFLRMGRWF